MRPFLLLLTILVALTACTKEAEDVPDRGLTFTYKGGVTQMERTLTLDENGVGTAVLSDNRSATDIIRYNLPPEQWEELKRKLEDAGLGELESSDTATDPNAIHLTLTYGGRTLEWDSTILASEGPLVDLLTHLLGMTAPSPGSPLNEPTGPGATQPPGTKLEPDSPLLDPLRSPSPEATP